MSQKKSKSNNIRAWTDDLAEREWALHADRYRRLAEDIIDDSQPSAHGRRINRFGRKLAAAFVLTVCLILGSLIIAAVPELHAVALNFRDRVQGLWQPKNQIRFVSTMPEAEAAVHHELPRLTYLPAGYAQSGDIAFQEEGGEFIITETLARGTDYMNVCYENSTINAAANPSQVYTQITYDTIEDGEVRTVLISTQPPYAAEVLYDTLRISIVGSALTREEILQIVHGIQYGE